jgi:hypothetical protein
MRSNLSLDLCLDRKARLAPNPERPLHASSLFHYVHCGVSLVLYFYWIFSLQLFVCESVGIGILVLLYRRRRIPIATAAASIYLDEVLGPDSRFLTQLMSSNTVTWINQNLPRLVTWNSRSCSSQTKI